MAMTLRLDDDDDRMLTEEAARTGRSKQEIAKEAIHLHLTANQEVFEAMLARTMNRHAELQERLA
ncbi:MULTISPECIES: ribbon-helix-helix protein, CopG family [unclassified Nocardia]|uniref:ribbon-helix-helix protein, CopG family n=1 Tax=unclassified Nocardia TaxID=2637762 RepID=UPI0034331106